jgi:small subunit ribosomal protein S21
VQVLVRDNNVDQALRALKKKMQREGIFREMKMRDFYEKPSQKRAREKAEAVRRVRKLARKRAQREGLIGGGRAVRASSLSPAVFLPFWGCMHMEAGTKYSSPPFFRTGLVGQSAGDLNNSRRLE